MDLRDRPQDSAFRAEVRQFLEEHVVGEFAELGGRGGSGDETFGFDVRLRWEKVLAEGGWIGLAWPTEYGGRGASMTEQVIFHEEYVRAAAPGRVSVMGEGLLAPTLIHYGTEAQKERFLPPILAGTELWCQGYSEPDAGSDLANVKTRAVRDGDEWVITGQKVWTSLAHQSDWCFVVCRTDPESQRHKGLSYLLVPMDQPGVEVRPITQLTKTSEFNEVFFDGARTAATNIVGAEGEGWRVSLATLAFERGVALLGHQLGFVREFDRLVALARENGRARDAVIRQRLAQAYAELTIMRYNTLRSLSGIDGPVAPPEASISKLFWGSWHRRLGELALDVIGPSALIVGVGDGIDTPGGTGDIDTPGGTGGIDTPGGPGGIDTPGGPGGIDTTDGTGDHGDHGDHGAPYELDDFQRSFLFSRAETIYGGSNQIQRNIIGERVLGLPPEPKGGT